MSEGHIYLIGFSASRTRLLIPHILVPPSLTFYKYFHTFSHRQITGLRKGKGQELQRTVKAANTTTRGLHRRASFPLLLTSQKNNFTTLFMSRVIVYIRHSCRATQCRYHGTCITWEFTVQLPPPPAPAPAPWAFPHFRLCHTVRHLCDGVLSQINTT